MTSRVSCWTKGSPGPDIGPALFKPAAVCEQEPTTEQRAAPVMSQAPSEALIRRYYDAFNKGDTEGMLACLSDDVVHDVNQGVRRPGKEAFKVFCAHMTRCYHEQLKDIVVMTSGDGTRVAAEFNVHGTYLATDEGLPPAAGQTYVLPGGTFFAVRDGLITRVTTYYNLTDWLMQVAGDTK
jgi:steroid delta-isomerase-like uncharacterized protein